MSIDSLHDPCDVEYHVKSKGRRYAFCIKVLVALLVGLAFLLPIASAQVFNDPGFGTELVATLPAYSPVGLAWSPDGRLFVWQKNGIVRIVKNGVLLPTPFIDLSSQVNTFDDRGMWGLAFHPDFVNNGYVYLSYVYENAGNPNDTSPKTSRLVRVTANSANPDVALTGSLVVILSGLPADSGSHDIGTLRFAPDGKLFVGNGDGADAAFTDPNSLRAQDLSSYSGKILRINPDGTAPGDNPFDDGTDSIRSKVWCYGLRNPYRFSLDPQTGAPYMGDVGWNTWEEINKGIPGANYGWPFYEGSDPQPSYQATFGPGPSQSSVTMPLFTYSHSIGSAIILGPFYTGTQYPASYQGSLFFGDYSGNWIRRVVFDATGAATSFPYFATSVLAPVSIEQGPDGMLYYLSFTTGEIRRIRYNGPIAVASATPSYGYSPLTVSFSSDGSTDTGGGSISYSWSFGDGSTSSSVPNPSHTYIGNAPTSFIATLTVRNSANLTSTATTKVTVGSAPPSPTITTPANGTGYMPGQTVPYQGSATDPDDGVLQPSSLSWTILLHHNTHIHTFVGGSGSQGSFVAANHGTIGSFYYEIILTATDSSGLKASTSVSIPIIADTALPTAPVGLTATAASSSQINLGWTAATDNAAVASYLVERQGGGNANFVQVATASGTTYSDSGLTPATAYIYRIRAADASGNLGPYSNVVSATTSNAPPNGLVAAYAFSEGSGTTVADASGNGNTGTIQGATWTTQGKFGGALSFNGSSNLVAINGAQSLNITSAMTLEAWIYPTATQSGWRTIMQRQTDAYFLNASNDSGPLRPAGGATFGGTVSYVSGPTASPVNTWTHVALTYDGVTLRLYVNGNQAASKAVSGGIETNSNALRIGGNVPYGEYFQGSIDEVRVYNRALSQTEIQTDMNTPVGGTSANTPPTITSIQNQTTLVNTAAGPVSFTVGDAETAAGSLTLGGSSSNTTLVPNPSIAFGGSGAGRTITVTPASGQTGTSTITVTVSDGTATASTSFLLTVSGSSNTPPTISSIANQTTAVNTAAGPISFTVGDLQTAAGSLTLSGSSSNTTLIPNANIAFGGSGASRTITVTPASGQTGTSTITVTVSDGTATASTSFLLTVSGSSNTPPTISSIANQTTAVNTAAGPISFTVGDLQTAAGSLTLSGSSSNTTLIPNANIAFGGSGASRTITVTPASGQTGTSTITVTVSDGTATASTSFLLTVSGSGPAGLVAAYSFNAGAGTTLADVSGNANTGTIQGATWTTGGKYGAALVFNGSSNRITVNDSNSLDLTNGMTLEAWVYPTATPTNWSTVVMKEQSGELVYVLYAGSPANRPNPYIYTTGEQGFAGPSALPLNAWSHLAATYDGATLRLYVNATQVASATISGNIIASTGVLRIGGNGVWGEYFRGRIDEVRIYNRALGQTEIQTDMNTPLTP